MRRIISLFSAFAATLALAAGAAFSGALSHAETKSHAKPPPPGLKFSLATPRGVYDAAKEIAFVATAKNESNQVIEWDSNGCPVDLQAKDPSGQVVWHPTALCTMILIRHRLKPGQKASWSYKWSAGPKSRGGGKRDPGTYVAIATLNGFDLRSSATFRLTTRRRK
jgi:hypothetical protein